MKINITTQNGLRIIVQCEISAKNILLTNTGHNAHDVYCVVGHPQSYIISWFLTDRCLRNNTDTVIHCTAFKLLLCPW